MPMKTEFSKKSTRCGCGENYCRNIELLREEEYPFLKGSVYLDHAGATPYAASIVKSISHDMMSNLYSNPHSKSPSSRRSMSLIDNVRLRALAFFNADPNDYDLVFVANATAAIKLVAESFRDAGPHGFQYGYHIDSHASLVALREHAVNGYRCLADSDVAEWISKRCIGPSSPPSLFAFPAQSNLNGRRLPLHWCEAVRHAAGQQQRNVFSLLDAASYVSTAPLDVDKIGPDFVALSFYRIFGLPNLGALIVRKDSLPTLDGRKLFGGCTVDMVIALSETLHARRKTLVHERFEDGALHFHTIIALGAALSTHERLYGSMANISVHTEWLAKEAYDRLSTLRHLNGTKLCQMCRSEYGNAKLQGPIIAFNLRNSRGNWIPKTDVEERAATRGILLRSGSVCNLEGTASVLRWADTDLRQLYTAGISCGDDNDIHEGRPTGVLRISLGAMTSHDDIQALVHFIRDTYVENVPDIRCLTAPRLNSNSFAAQLFVERLTVFPILGYGGFNIPDSEPWEIHGNGLAWNHAWCLVHETTNEILESHIYPRMLKIRPIVQLHHRVLHLSCRQWTETNQFNVKIPLPIAQPKQSTMPIINSVKYHNEILHVQKYDMRPVKTFFTKVVGEPCTLAMICSPHTSQTSPEGGTYRRRLQNLFRHGSRLSCGKPGSDCCFSPCPVENCTPPILKSSVQCEHIISSSEAKAGNLISNSEACRESHANIMVGEQKTRLTYEKYPFRQYDLSAIRIGPGQVQFDSVPRIGTGNREPLEVNRSVSVSIRQLIGHVTCENYEVRSAEKGNNHRRTIAVGDIVLPAG